MNAKYRMTEKAQMVRTCATSWTIIKRYNSRKNKGQSDKRRKNTGHDQWLQDDNRICGCQESCRRSGSVECKEMKEDKDQNQKKIIIIISSMSLVERCCHHKVPQVSTILCSPPRCVQTNVGRFQIVFNSSSPCLSWSPSRSFSVSRRSTNSST